MKVFIVIGDNGEPYEDNYTWIERVFKTLESAEAYAAEKNAEIDTNKDRLNELLYIEGERELKNYEEDERFNLEYCSMINGSYKVKGYDLYE